MNCRQFLQIARTAIVRTFAVAAVILAFAVPPSPSEARDLLEQQLYWYEPEPLSNIDEAASTLVSLEKFFIFYGGIPLDQIVVTRDGIALHGSQTSIRQNSQYVPSYGGAWIGGRYVPYYGGTTVTTPVPVTSELQRYLSYSDITNIAVLHFPYMNLSWGVAIADRDSNKSVTLRTSSQALARQFADATVTLIEKNNPDFMRTFNVLGFIGKMNDAKAFKKAKYTGGFGYIINDVARGGPSDLAGLRKGDIIVSVNGQNWTKIDNFVEVVGTAWTTDLDFVVDLQVFRDRTLMPVSLKIHNIGLERSLALNPPKLGTSIRDVTSLDPVAPGRNLPTGVFIIAVYPNSLAQRMDFRQGDVVIELNGRAVANGEQYVAEVEARDIKSAKVLRGGAVVELLAPAPTEGTPQPLGLEVREVPGANGMPGYLNVVTVDPAGAAALLGLRAGDKLIGANGKDVFTTSDLAEIIAAGPIVTAMVERAGERVPLGGITRF